MKEVFEFKGRPFIVTPVMEERIINVAYEDGSLLDRMIVGFVRKRNPRVESLYLEHMECVRFLRIESSKISCSGTLSERLLHIPETGVETPVSNIWGLIQRGLLSIQGATAVVAAVVFAFVVANHFSAPRVDDQELEEATLQAKATLAMISDIMNGTKDTIHDKVIIEYTAKPIHDSIFKGTETIKNNL